MDRAATNIPPARAAGLRSAPPAPLDTVLDWQPPDTHWIAKLRRLREVRLVTLWETDAARLFVGVSSDGLPGINLSSRRPPRALKKRRNIEDTGDWRWQQPSLIHY